MKSAIVWQVWGFEVGAYLAGFTAQVDAIAFSRERNASCAVPFLPGRAMHHRQWEGGLTMKNNTDCQFMCFCGRPCLDIRWSERFQGLETIGANGRGCCSHFENEYPTEESAARQLASTRAHFAKRMDEALEQSHRISLVDPDDR